MNEEYTLEFFKSRNVKSPIKHGEAARLGFFYS